MSTEMQELVEKIIEEQSKITLGGSKTEGIKAFGEYEAYKKVLVHILNSAKKDKTEETIFSSKNIEDLIIIKNNLER